MAGTSTAASQEVQQEINVLPLIDVLLVLIIIFFVMQRVLIFIPAQVPPPAMGGPRPVGAQIVLELKADGAWAINSQPIPDEQLDTQLRAIFVNRPAKLLFIKVAEERPYQDMVTAMDRARGAGVEVLAWVPRQARP
jgi:biopolymer transport protein ExbD